MLKNVVVGVQRSWITRERENKYLRCHLIEPITLQTLSVAFHVRELTIFYVRHITPPYVGKRNRTRRPDLVWYSLF